MNVFYVFALVTIIILQHDDFQIMPWVDAFAFTLNPEFAF